MEKKPRRTPNLTEKAAACLLMLRRGTGEWLIPEPIRISGTAQDIVRCVEWHHENYYAEGGTTDPRMLTPLPPEIHHERTEKVDKKRIAHNKRLRAKEEDFRKRILAKHTGDISETALPKRKWPTKKLRSSAAKTEARQ